MVQFLLWIKRFYIIPYFFCSLPDNLITHDQIKHIWVYLVYIPHRMADGYYRNVQVGRRRHYYMYSYEFPWFIQYLQLLMDWDRSDTLEHCIICVSFIFCMNLILTLAFTRRIAVVCAFEIHFSLSC